MYGLIYSTLQSLVVDQVCNGSDEKWKQICREAGVEVPDEFLHRRYYDETMLEKIAVAATKVLEIPLPLLLEMFGAKFVEVTNRIGHSRMLHTLGHNLYGFLCNLDSLHNHLSYTYDQMQAPSFSCEKTNGGLLLHYYSKRKGLHSIVRGIVKSVAKDYFALDVDMKLECEERLETERLCNHYIFTISVLDSTKDDNYMNRLSGINPLEQPFSSGQSVEVRLNFNQPTCPISSSGSDDNTQAVLNITSQPSITVAQVDESKDDTELKKVNSVHEPIHISKTDEDKVKQQLFELLPLRIHLPLLPELSAPSHGPPTRGSLRSIRRNSLFIPTNDEWPITPEFFQRCFPFHVIFDYDMVIKHMGDSLRRLYPVAIGAGRKITDYFDVVRPALPAFTYSNIRKRDHNEFILQTKVRPRTSRNTTTCSMLQFRGEMIVVAKHQSSSPIVFLCSPRVLSIDDLDVQGLFLSEIPVHDVTRDLILMKEHLHAEMNIAHQLEETKQKLVVEQARVQEEKDRADQLLHAMLPPSIAAELTTGVEASATEHEMVSIMLSDIKGFTSICGRCQPMQVVSLLNDLYTRFDHNIDRHKVYKVETIGDAYMIAAGPDLLNTAANHAAAVTEFGFSMREEASYVLDPNTFVPIEVRIGIHSGPVVAGVVGLKMPRYCFFGNTVNLASRMESNGREGKLHISRATYDCLQQQSKPFHFERRGLIKVKGVEDMMETYWVEPAYGETSITTLAVPSDERRRQSRSNSFISFDSRRKRSLVSNDDSQRKLSLADTASLPGVLGRNSSRVHPTSDSNTWDRHNSVRHSQRKKCTIS